MDARLLVTLTGLGLLGFLFYPRADPPPAPGAVEYVTTGREAQGEPARLAGIQRPDPPVHTYDLGFVYRVDRMELLFKNASDNGPKLYEVLAGPAREGPYRRIFTFRGSSRAYPYTVQRFPDSHEARWVQLVVGDWFSGKPGVESLQVGPVYRRDWNPIESVSTSHNSRDAGLLVDGLRHELSRWAGARVEETVTEADGQEITERAYLPPGGDVTITADLGAARRVYGSRITADGSGHGPRGYTVALSEDGVSYKPAFSTGLPDDGASHPAMLPAPARARYVRWTIAEGDWYGEYPVVREVEVFTDSYRLAAAGAAMQDYTPILVREDNCGVDNRRAPNLTQGFAFDRGGDAPGRYMWSSSADIEGEATERQRSFAYHYDTLRLSYRGLRADRLYWLQTLYQQDTAGERRQNLIVDGYLLHGDEVAVPAAASDPTTYAIPADALTDGALDIAINRLAGANAVLSAAWLYEAHPGSTGVSVGDETRPAKVTRAAEPKTIDGSLAEWDRLYPLVPAAGGPCRMYVEWDAENLYIAVTTSTSAMPAAPAVGDTIDVFIDTTNARSPALYREGDLHLRVYRYGSRREEVRYITHYSEHAAAAVNPPPVEMASSVSGGEYTLEARLPRVGMLTAWTPAEGGRFGINFITSLRPDRRWWLTTDRRDDPPIRWREARMIGPVRANAWLGSIKEPNGVIYAGSDVLVVVRDPDANTDPDAVDEVTVRLEGATLGDTLDITLREVRGDQLGTRPPDEAMTPDGEYFAALARTRHVDRTELRAGIALTGGEAVTLTYIDKFAHPSGAAETISAEATVATGADGTISLAAQGGPPLGTFRAGEMIVVVVEDADLTAGEPSEPEPEPTTEDAAGEQPDGTEVRNARIDGAPFKAPVVTARVRRADGVGLGDVETVALARAEDGTFTVSIPTLYAEEPQEADGVLQLSGMDRVEVTYLDRVQQDGNTDVGLVAAARVAIGATAALTLRGAGGDPATAGSGPVHVTAGSPVIVVVEDGDMNHDRSVAETVTVLLTTIARGDSLRVTLEESDVDTGVFRALAPTAYAAAVDRTNGILELTGSEQVTATYVDDLQGSGRTGVDVTAAAIARTGGDATLAIVRGDYVQVAPTLNAGGTVYLRLVEPDARAADLVVEVRSLATGDTETVVLAASVAGASEYVGAIPTTFAATGAAEDGVLAVLGDDTVRGTYVDALRASGEPNTTVTADALVNTGSDGVLRLPPGGDIPLRAGTPLAVEVRDPDLNARSAVLEQTTVTARVDPGGDTLDILLRETGGDTGVFVGAAPTVYAMVGATDDALQITGQSAITVEYLDAIRADGETGSPRTATRYVATGAGGSLQLLSLDGRRPVTRLTPGDMVLARVADSDLNISPNFDESTQIRVTGSILGDTVLLPMRETGVNTGIFEVRVATEHVAEGAEHDRLDLLLQVVDRELVTATYVDELTDAGEPMRAVQRSAVAAVTGVATVLLEDAYGVEIGEFLAGAPLFVSLDDPLLAADASGEGPTVVLESLLTGDTVAVVTEALPGGQGRYWARVATKYAATATADDVLEVQGGDETRVRYRHAGRATDAFDSAAVASGSRGALTVTYADGRPLTMFTPGASLHVRLEDPDRDLSTFDVDEVIVRVTAQGGERRDVRLRETAAATGVFRGVARTGVAGGSGPDATTALPLRGGEGVVVSYLDPLVATGEVDVEVTASCRARRIGAAPFTAEPLVIDGIADRWPLEDAMAPAEGGALVWAQWGRDALYVFAQVSDDHVEVSDVTRWHEGSDALELHFDLDMDRQGSPAHLGGSAQPSEYVFWICPTGGGMNGDEPYVGRAQPGLVHNYSAVDVAVRRNEGSYSLEARIPFHTALPGFDPITSTRRDRVGFNYLLYRSAAPQVWWAPLGTSTENASQAGILYLERDGS